jgi:hypothetical protein
MISVYKFYVFAADLNNGDYLAKQRQLTDLFTQREAVFCAVRTACSSS